MNERVNETQDTPEIDALEADSQDIEGDDAPETVMQAVNDRQLNELREKKNDALKKRSMHRRGTPIYQRLDDEFQSAKRNYSRRYFTLKKRIQRANDKGVQPDIVPPDPFTQWFASRSLSDRRAFILANPRFLQIAWPRHLSNALKLAAAPMVKDIVKNFGFTEAEAAEEALSIISQDVARSFGMSIIEVNSILDGSYKPEPFTSLASVNNGRPGPMPASGVRRLPGVYDGYQWCEVSGGVNTHVLVELGTPDAVVRKIAGCGA